MVYTEGKNLEEKVNEAESKMPGVKGYLKPHRGGFFDTTYTVGVEDVECLETPDYQVVAAKKEQHLWSDYGGGIEWTEWISVYYQKKGTSEIKEIETPKIVTRHQSDPYYDKDNLWPYNFVSIKNLEENSIEVDWMDREGFEGLAYNVNLGSGEVTNIDLLKRIKGYRFDEKTRKVTVIYKDGRERISEK